MSVPSSAPRLFGLKGAAIKEKLRRKETVTVAGLWFPNPLIAEMVAQIGFDVLVLDLEHGPWDVQTVTGVLTATAPYSSAIVIRPGGLDREQIQLMLDLGVDGVMLAHCDDLDTTRRAVSAVRYPPLGARGVGPTRTGAYLDDMIGYLRAANDSIMLWIQVERRVERAELRRMLDLPGVDALMLGPADIAAAAGHLTEWDHPDVIKIISDTVAVAREAGKPFGVPGGGNVLWSDQLIRLGTSDIGSMRAGLEQALKAMRGTAGKPAAEHHGI